MSSTISSANSAAASSKPSPTANTKANRLPAPTLFVGPPSRNASQLSISRTATHDSSRPTRDALSRQKSGLSRPFNPDHEASIADGDALKENGTLRPLKKASDKNIEAKWKEMQSTLNEVELTAQSSTHVFGESHAAALDELRKAQVELARAWGRGNENKASGAENDLELNINRFKGAEDLAMDRRDQHRKRADTAASTSTALSDESMRSDSTVKSGRSQLEDETAQDIKLASERRAANEAYFKKVDSGVKDVVSKLEAVAEAMRGVEGESRSLWSNSDRSSTSLDTQDQGQPGGKKAG